jgi:hypothetical protein
MENISTEVPQNTKNSLGVVMHTYNPGTQEVKAPRLKGSKVQDQPELHSKTLSQKMKKNKKP